MEYKLRERVNYICSNWYITILNYLSEFKFKVACLKCNCKLYENYSKWEKKIMELRFHKLEFTKYFIQNFWVFMQQYVYSIIQNNANADDISQKYKYIYILLFKLIFLENWWLIYK